ncbi:hypothetical protein [Halobaculum sp. MBLA0143]|uniref:hypothetical protein n=1 Tax=Halobaculum sp. MBLA0143 TaxID=3079933 RepID=UPI0035258477
MSVTLDLFAAAGFDRLSILQRELSARVDETDADAVFVESSDDEFGLTAWARAFLRSPATATGFGLYSLVGYALYALGTRSISSPQECAADRLETDRSTPVYRVEGSSSGLFSTGGLVSTLVEWVAVAATAFVFSATGVATTVAAAFLAPTAVRLVARSTQTLAALLAVLLTPAVALLLVVDTGSTAALAVGVFAFLVASARQTGDRAAATLDRVERVSAEHGHERVLLLATQTTVSNLRGRQSDSPGPEIASAWVRRAFREGRRSEATTDA